ncbi:hypothetical protein ACWOCJ_09420, partial [Enterococcus pseudoavium]
MLKQSGKQCRPLKTERIKQTKCVGRFFFRSKQHSKQYASKSIITIELNNRKIVSNTLYESLILAQDERWR